MILALSFFIFGIADKGEGYLDLLYRPIWCETPCPQFVVESVNGEKVTNVAADIANMNVKKSPIANFHKISVKGSWEKVKNTAEENPEYIRIQVKEWSSTIKGKVSDE